MANPVVRFVKSLVLRVYALIVMLAILVTAYVAISYLVRAVFQPTQVPAWFVNWQGSLNAEALRQPEVAGVTGPAARAPLRHYHGVDRWFQPDPKNGCTISGCHGPLPHANSKELRAFANLHATFLACEMCHAEPGRRPMPATWLSLEAGRPQEPPAALRLMKLLETERDKVEKEPASVHNGILTLLSELLGIAPHDTLMSYLRVQLETSQPGSPVWRHAVEQLTAELPNHARGEYGAKIAPAEGAAAGVLSPEELAAAARRYLGAPPESVVRAEAKKEIHKGIVERPEGCLACHDEKPGRLDFESLGYWRQRAEALAGAPIAHLMQQIQQGQPFHLPGILEGRDGK